MTSTADKGGSLLGWLLPLLALTVLAGGGGVIVARQIVAQVKATLAAEVKAPTKAPEALAASQTAVRELAPMVTNLAAPDGSIVRLQAAIIYDKADAARADVLAAQIGDDTLAFLKTLTLAQLQGAEGLQQLREDLGERAALRSEGRVKDVLIEMLVVQ